jgi:hypothetical protein
MVFGSRCRKACSERNDRPLDTGEPRATVRGRLRTARHCTRPSGAPAGGKKLSCRPERASAGRGKPDRESAPVNNGGDRTAFEVVGLEVRNVVANYHFERSHRFAGIQPNPDLRDHSRLSCGEDERLASFLRDSYCNFNHISVRSFILSGAPCFQ